VDARPQLERTAARALAACYVLIGACAVLGGVTAGALALALTRTVPKET
jgi:hypothetical protein